MELRERQFTVKSFVDHSGKRFNRWTVVSYAGKEKKGGACVWNCVCDCGNTRLIRSSTLTAGESMSCGCLARQLSASRNKTHGKCTSNEYFSWSHAKNRCFNKNDPGFIHYGKLGVTMCDRWKNSFELFYADMGDMPAPGYTLERIISTGNYEPGNCRWATKIEQNRNKRYHNWIEHEGKKMFLADWARELKVSESTLRDTLKKRSISDYIQYLKNKRNDKS